MVTAFHSRMTGREFNDLGEAGVLRCCVPRFPLGPGTYTVALAATLGAETSDEVDRAQLFNVVEGDYFGTGTSLSDKVEFLCEHAWETQRNRADVMIAAHDEAGTEPEMYVPARS
jgi:hypothetical protein